MTAAQSFNIARILTGYSIEVHPGDAKALDAAQERLNPGTEVFLTWTPGTNPMDLVAVAANLRHAGLWPVPHIGARHLESSAQLEHLASRFADAGVDRILVIGGAGYIGSHAVRLFLARGHDVWVYDNLSMGHRAAVPAERLIVGVSEIG